MHGQSLFIVAMWGFSEKGFQSLNNLFLLLNCAFVLGDLFRAFLEFLEIGLLGCVGVSKFKVSLFNVVFLDNFLINVSEYADKNARR